MYTLSQWMKAQGFRDKDVADRIGRTVAAVCRYRQGLRIPDRDAMDAIFKLTGGLVGPNEFYGLPAPDGEAAETAGAAP